MLAPFKNLNSIYSYSLNNTKYQLSASTTTYSYPSTVRRGFCDTFFAYSFNLKKQKKKKKKTQREPRTLFSHLHHFKEHLLDL